MHYELVQSLSGWTGESRAPRRNTPTEGRPALHSSAFESPRSHFLSGGIRCALVLYGCLCCHVAATRPEHRKHAPIGIRDPIASATHDVGEITRVRLRDVNVEHRLVDPFVPEPRLQPPRVHAFRTCAVACGTTEPAGQLAGRSAPSPCPLDRRSSPSRRGSERRALRGSQTSA